MKYLKLFIHFIAAVCILFLGDSFRNEFPNFLFHQRVDSRFLIWSCYLLSVFLAMWIYCHYVLKVKAADLGIFRVKNGIKWLLLSLALAMLVLAFYFFFVPGKLYIYASSTRDVLRSIYYWLFSSTVFVPIAEGWLYRGMIFSAMKKEWGERQAIWGLSLILGIINLFVAFDEYRLSDTIFLLLVLFVWNLLLCLMTVESGSVWGAIFCDMIIKTLVSGRLFYINGIEMYTDPHGVLFSYWILSKNPCLLGVKGGIDYNFMTSVPVFLCIGILIVIVCRQQKIAKALRRDAVKFGWR